LLENVELHIRGRV